MPTSQKLKTTLATLEGVLADFKTFYMETSDNQTKTMFQTLITQTEGVFDQLKARIDEVSSQEIQYRKEKQ